MNGIQSRRVNHIEKPIPGCLGRMVDLFDLSTGMAGNRLLPDKPHPAGSSLSRSQSDVARTWSPTFGDQVEDKMIVSELRKTSNKRANGTPMKALIAQEMSKEVEGKQSSPNIVAKLMGLEALPRQRFEPGATRNHLCYPQHASSHSDIPLGCWQQDEDCWDKGRCCEIHPCLEQNNYKDVHEIWKQSQNTNHIRYGSPQRGRHNENSDEKKMALIRQKFMEAKRLVTDERLRQSKEFQDALEVLNSNTDLLVKFFREPNSLFSQRLYELQSTVPAPETRRITVLRPSKMVHNEKFAGSGQKIDESVKKTPQDFQAPSWEQKISRHSPTIANQKVNEHLAQPTRIVVLKPNPGKTHDTKTVVSPPHLSPRIGDYGEEPEEDDEQTSREVAKEITQQMCESLMGHRRDETLLSSVFSNGYIGDESSFDKSENEYAVGNLSDSEVMSPTSRHSWDYINRFGSPYSSASFSRASCSPESSVCREAKKRLSERWAMMASNSHSQDQKHARKSSSTLGEMLALSDIKKSVRSEEEGNNSVDEPRVSTSSLTHNYNNGGNDSPKNLVRSKSVPVSSTVYGAGLSVEASNHEASEKNVTKELTKTKSTKSTLRGKVSSLFFLRSKRVNKERTDCSKDQDQCGPGKTAKSPVLSPGKSSEEAAQSICDGGLEECKSSGHCASSGKTSPDLTSMGQKPAVVSPESGSCENQDHPSPISVLDPPFEDDNATPESCGNIKPDLEGSGVGNNPLRSNLIDKSPPIGSISRTLSWDDCSAEIGTRNQLKPSVMPGMEEEEDWFLCVQRLLSMAGLGSGAQADLFFSKWHSPEEPLDPSLREKCADLDNKAPLHESDRRRSLANWKLIFDCVNSALLEIAGYGLERSVGDRPRGGVYCMLSEGASPNLVDSVWARMKEWFSSGASCVLDDCGDSNSLVVDRVVRKELVGRAWVEQMRIEVDILGKEIGGKLLEDLVEEAVVDLTDIL